MKNYSLWKDVEVDKLKSLEEDMSCDVLIIGGGVTGLSILYSLKDSPLKTLLLESDTCGMGVTSKSTAKITYLQEDLYLKIKKASLRQAELYLKSQRDAVDKIVDIIKRENIDCDLMPSPSYLFTNDNKKLKSLSEEYEFLKSNGVDVEIDDNPPLNFKTLGAIRVDDTYVFHPLKYVNGLKNILKSHIYENSKVDFIEKDNNIYKIHVGDHVVRTKTIVFATHYPYFLFPFLMPFKTHIEVSYVGAKKTKDKNTFNAINIDKDTKSIRYHKDKKSNYYIELLNSSKTSNVSSIKDNFEDLKSREDFDCVWSNNDIMTSDCIPFIGRLKSNDDTLLIATGFNTWGFTNATISGSVIRDIIEHKNNKYISLFDPKRSINLAKVTSFPLDLTSNVKSFIKGFKNDSSSVRYTKKDGKSVAIYKDPNGVEHIVLNKCPHMMCGIKFNEVEKTWDCMCHGSRFDIDGRCIEGPSNIDITFHEKK